MREHMRKSLVLVAATAATLLCGAVFAAEPQQGAESERRAEAAEAKADEALRQIILVADEEVGNARADRDRSEEEIAKARRDLREANERNDQQGVQDAYERARQADADRAAARFREQEAKNKRIAAERAAGERGIALPERPSPPGADAGPSGENPLGPKQPPRPAEVPPREQADPADPSLPERPGLRFPPRLLDDLIRRSKRAAEGTVGPDETRRQLEDSVFDGAATFREQQKTGRIKELTDKLSEFNEIQEAEKDKNITANGIGSDLDSELARYQRAVTEHDRAAQGYDSDAAAFIADEKTHVADVKEFNTAVRAYEALPPEQRSKAEGERLQRWRARLEPRSAELRRRGTDMIRRRDHINARKATLDAERAELVSKGQRLDLSVSPPTARGVGPQYR